MYKNPCHFRIGSHPRVCVGSVSLCLLKGLLFMVWAAPSWTRMNPSRSWYSLRYRIPAVSDTFGCMVQHPCQTKPSLSVLASPRCWHHLPRAWANGEQRGSGEHGGPTGEKFAALHDPAGSPKSGGTRLWGYPLKNEICICL